VNFPEEAREWAKVEYACALNCIVVALESGRIVFLRLAVIAQFVTDVKVFAINFWRGNNSFIVIGADGKVWVLPT
jgi:hypothetical protein